jgi:hypothetical protein
MNLPSLLWTVLSSLEQVHIAQGSGVDGMPSLDQWSNLLRALDTTGVPQRDLPMSLRLSKRAVRARLSIALRRGWIEGVKPGAGQAEIRLTPHGSETAARWKRLQHDAEQQWQTAIGLDAASKLRASLESLVSVLPLEHPHYPASYGAADASITGGNGNDWKAVVRDRGDTVSHLPLSALLSQVVVAFAIGYEERSPVALSLSTTIIGRIPPGGRFLRELGYSAGLSALARHGFVRVAGKNGAEVVTLTSQGCAVQDAYRERIQAVETEWRDGFGHETIASLRGQLEETAEFLQRRTTTPQPC